MGVPPKLAPIRVGAHKSRVNRTAGIAGEHCPGGAQGRADATRRRRHRSVRGAIAELRDAGCDRGAGHAGLHGAGWCGE